MCFYCIMFVLSAPVQFHSFNITGMQWMHNHTTFLHICTPAVCRPCFLCTTAKRQEEGSLSFSLSFLISVIWAWIPHEQYAHRKLKNRKWTLEAQKVIIWLENVVNKCDKSPKKTKLTNFCGCYSGVIVVKYYFNVTISARPTQYLNCLK